MRGADSADVVVIGAGISGACTALHLLGAGVSDVLVLDSGEPACGTSAVGAGFVMTQAILFLKGWEMIEMEAERYALQFYRALSQDGEDIGLRENGNLLIAATEEGWNDHLRSFEERSELVPDQVLLGPRDVEDITDDLIDRAGVYRAVYHPSSIHVSAPQATAAAISGFQRRGGRVRTNCRVERVTATGGRISGALTAEGHIAADAVVLAAGPWTNALLRPLETWLPMVPLVAIRALTAPLGAPSSLPTVLVPDLSTLWLREERGCLYWGCPFDEPPRFTFVDGAVPDDVSALERYGIEPMEWARRAAATLVPAVSSTPVASVAYGAPTFTADARALLGPVDGFDGLYVFAGDNEAGITHGPGYGRLLAGLIAGQLSLEDVAPLAPNRFGSHYSSGSDVVAAMKRSHANVW